jgi:hypothetical protein
LAVRQIKSLRENRLGSRLTKGRICQDKWLRIRFHNRGPGKRDARSHQSQCFTGILPLPVTRMSVGETQLAFKVVPWSCSGRG